MFRSSALKAWQKAAFAATAISLASAFSLLGPSKLSSPTTQSQGRFRQLTRVGFVAPRVHCQEAVWEVEESDSYYYEKMHLPDRATETSHVIFGQLLREGCIEKYDVYKRINRLDRESPELILSDIQLGDQLDGHAGVVHGGILALLFDDAMGMAFGALGVEKAFTANLNVNYRAPTPAGSRLILCVRLSKQEGRKLHFSAQLTNLDRSLLYAEATCLYIIPRDLMENQQQ